MKVGAPLDHLQLAASIDRLFYTGLYDDVKVDAEPDGDGVRLKYITVAQEVYRPRGRAAARSSDPPNRSVILGDAQLGQWGQPFDPDLVEAARKRIESGACGRMACSRATVAAQPR